MLLVPIRRPAYAHDLVHVMTLARSTAGINKADAGSMAHGQTRSADTLRQVLPTTVPAMNFVARFASRQPSGLIVVWQMCYPVQHMLGAAASMASGATLRGILLRAVSGCCYNNGGLRDRRWANAITKHGSKGEWQTSVQSLPSTVAERPVAQSQCWPGALGQTPKISRLASLVGRPKLKPRWDVHLSGDVDQLGCAGESLSSVLGE